MPVRGAARHAGGLGDVVHRRLGGVEDGIAGFCDDGQRLCFGIALWNGQDPILKERMFGLTNAEGNHGEDVKDYYFVVDATPTSSYLAMRYRCPLVAFPYNDLVTTNRARNRMEFEYELLDTGVFDDDRYVDVDVEYAKVAPEDVLIRITLTNRSADGATIRLLPTLWFRNTWWMDQPKGQLGRLGERAIGASHPDLGDLQLRCEGEPVFLFTENGTNSERLWGAPNEVPYVKDAFDDYVVHGRTEAVNPEGVGTKAAVLYVPAAGERTMHLRLCRGDAPDGGLGDIEPTFTTRQAEADEFFASITPPTTSGVARGMAHRAVDGDRLTTPGSWPSAARTPPR